MRQRSKRAQEDQAGLGTGEQGILQTASMASHGLIELNVSLASQGSGAKCLKGLLGFAAICQHFFLELKA